MARDEVLTTPGPVRFIPLTVRPGTTLLSLVQESGLPEDLYPYVFIRLNGVTVFDWAHTLIKDGDSAEFMVTPSGGQRGKQILSSVAMLALAVAAGPIGEFAAGQWFGGSVVAEAAITAGTTLVGSLLVRALIPPANYSSSGGSSTTSVAQEPRTYTYTGQSNEVRVYQRVPRIYGTMRFVPPLAATPLIVNTGKVSRVSVLYDFGLGNIEISDMRSGSLDVDTLDPEIRIHRNTAKPDLDFIARAVAYETLDYAMEQNQPVYLRTNAETIGSMVDVVFPAGLVRLTRSGERRVNAVGLRVRYRANGSTGAWTIVPASMYAGANKNQEALAYTAEYSANVIADEADVTTAWIVKIDAEENHKVSIWYRGRNIFNKKYNSADSIQAITVEGITFQRGVSRDSVVEPDEDSRTSYELLVGKPVAGNSVVLTAATGEPFVVSVRINFPTPGVWDIEVVRTTPVSDVTLYNSIRDESRINMLKNWKRGSVLNLTKAHSMVEMRYTATDKTSGVIQSFNAIARSLLRDFNQLGFNGNLAAGGNPALVAIDLLTGLGAKKPLTAAQIDWPSWTRLRNFCNAKITSTVNGITTTAPRHVFNGVIDGDLTMRDAVGAVLGMCRASLILTTAGKWGVLIDTEDNTPRQLITPQNSWGFSASRPFIELPDALRVAFTNADADWTAAEVLVYRDGKNASNATIIEDVATTGITNYAQAWRHGRYLLAQGIVRSETFTVSMDVENLAVQRGDKVLVQHDVPLFGGQAFRLTAVSATNKTVTLDAPIELGAGYFTARNTNGTIVSGTITGQVNSNTLRVSTTTGLNVDTLIVLDVSAAATEPYLVQAIEPGDDLTATLTLVKYDARVYTADTGSLPSWNPGFGQDILSKTSVAIAWVSVATEWIYIDSIPWLRLKLDWRVTAGQATFAGVNYDVSVGNEPWTSIQNVTDNATVYNHYIRYDERAYFDGAIRLRLRPYNTLGNWGTPIYRDLRLAAYNAIPAPPTLFAADVRSQEITLTWKASTSPDVINYVLRYHPQVDATAMWTTSQFLARVNADTTSFTVGARTGTYFLAAENVIGRQSNPVSTRTTIETLPDINVMETITPEPTWNGTMVGFTKGKTDAYSYALVRMLDGSDQQTAVPVGWDNTMALNAGGTVTILTDVTIDDTALVSRDTWGSDTTTREQAVFTYKDIIDLTVIYEVRISSLIEAYAVDAGVFASTMAEASFFGTMPSHQMSGIDIAEAIELRRIALARMTTPLPYADELTATAAVEFEANWDCWLEYRAVDELDVIADWLPSLSDVASMSLGQSEWGPWRPIRVGDATGRAFQFRIVAEADREGMLVIVTSGKLTVDMTDRTWRTNNLAVPASGLTVNFNPAFAAPPVIAVTIEGSTTAVRYTATNLTRTAVTIRLYNSAGTAVAGQIDLAALGYGKERSAGI